MRSRRAMNREDSMMSQLDSLSRLDTLQSDTAVDRASVKHCRSCFRKDIHRPVPIPPFAFGFLLVVTFGLILFVKPSSCVCCGCTRIF